MLDFLVNAATVILAIFAGGFLLMGVVYYHRRKLGKMILSFGVTLLLFIASFLVISRGFNPDLMPMATIVAAIIVGLGLVVFGIFWIIYVPDRQSHKRGKK